MVKRYTAARTGSGFTEAGFFESNTFVLASDYDGLAAEYAEYRACEKPEAAAAEARIAQLEAALKSARNDIREAIPVTKHEYTLRRLQMGEATITAALTAQETKGDES